MQNLFNENRPNLALLRNNYYLLAANIATFNHVTAERKNIISTKKQTIASSVYK